MGGDIQLEQSQQGLTVFRIRTPCKLPTTKQRVSQKNLDCDNLVNLENFTEIRRKLETWRQQLSSIMEVPTCIAQIYGQFQQQLNLTLEEYLHKLGVDTSQSNFICAGQELDEEIKSILATLHNRAAPSRSNSSNSNHMVSIS